jgi:hypothetical protein
VTRFNEDKPGWDWGMTLRHFDYKGAMRTGEKAERVADGNRMEYRRGDLVEWYINDGRGLEQGFTIAAPPGKQGNDPLLVELGLTGSLAPRAGKEGNAVLFEDARGETTAVFWPGTPRAGTCRPGWLFRAAGSPSRWTTRQPSILSPSTPC